MQGEQIQAAAPAEPQGQVIDLMEALKASVAAAEKPGAEERKPPRSVRPVREKEKATGRK